MTTPVVADYRSDTVTRPSSGMLKAMVAAEVGDDVMGEDPTVNRLERVAAERAGMEAGLFAPSGTQSNLLALMTHCQRGEEYIVGQEAHTYKFEAGGAAVLGSIQPQPLDFLEDGSLDLLRVEKAIKADDFHFARTRLLALENTQSGSVLGLDYQAQARELCDRHGLGLHLDGARSFNAAVKQRVTLEAITTIYDSVSICLSKGLGAPVGSVLCGSQGFIDRARRWRKMVGGGMRQSGILAAAGLYALEHNVDRLAEDHENALLLAEGLAQVEGIDCHLDRVQTNIFFIEFSSSRQAERLRAHLEQKGILISAGKRVRMVTHLDISREAIEETVATVANFHGTDNS